MSKLKCVHGRTFYGIDLIFKRGFVGNVIELDRILSSYVRCIQIIQNCPIIHWNIIIYHCLSLSYLRKTHPEEYPISFLYNIVWKVFRIRSNPWQKEMCVFLPTKKVGFSANVIKCRVHSSKSLQSDSHALILHRSLK